ncbi:MAG: hypothetical protein MR717_09150 [Prevotella sp.]|nr:hypothetical protein [Prevotella sp.]
MSGKLLKAPLDEKNVSPSDIIDELTLCENITNDNKAIGFVNNYPVMFIYYDNIMQLCFYTVDDMRNSMDYVADYIKEVQENTERLKITSEYAPELFIPKIILKFFWKDVEE